MDDSDDISKALNDPFPEGDPPDSAPIFMALWQVCGVAAALYLTTTLQRSGVDARMQTIQAGSTKRKK